MRILLLPLLGLAGLFSSCQTTDKSENTVKPETTEELSPKEQRELLAPEQFEIEKEESNTTIEPLKSPYHAGWTESFKKHLTLGDTILLLFPGQNNDMEIDSIASHLKWESLSRNGDILTGHAVNLQITPSEDPWGEEGNLDGTELGDDHPQSASIYISGIENLDGISMKDISSSILNKQILPGESFNFGPFTISATGDYDEEGYNYSNYSLKIAGMKDSLFIEQEILFQEYFDDAMISFYWIGDLDQDGLPDMLIDTSHKYSYSQPTLFLSSPCDQNTLVKKVAETSRFGC